MIQQQQSVNVTHETEKTKRKRNATPKKRIKNNYAYGINYKRVTYLNNLIIWKKLKNLTAKKDKERKKRLKQIFDNTR